MTILLIDDPRITSIPVVDRGDPLVDLGDLAPTAVGAARLARGGLANRLRTANAKLLPDGIRIRVVRGLSHLHRAAGDHRRLRGADPHGAAGLEQSAIDQLVSRYVAPLANAPHVAGAAVDLTLVGCDGRDLWMGSALDATPEESDGACFTAAAGLDTLAQVHRTLLVETLESVGLVNYPTEWWHWSYGDRYWAHVTNAPQALYGAVTRTAAA